MKEKPAERSERRKKPYQKPEVKQVPLKPEEAVLGYCKGMGTGAGSGGGCSATLCLTQTAGS
jgi:hypothetical protein